MARPAALGLTLAIVIALAAPASAQPTADVPAEAARVLAAIKAADTDQLTVSEEDGRLLRVLAVSSGATRALETGGASGYSAIWIALGLRQTGGRLTTIEYDPAGAQRAGENIRRAGLS